MSLINNLPPYYTTSIDSQQYKYPNHNLCFMTKVHPKIVIPIAISSNNPVVLTVWKKSLLYGCDGFTVYDSNGNLVFRVDNYPATRNREIVLMDATGNILHTIRRKMLSVADNFLVYDGETLVTPQFSVTKHMNVFNKKSLAYVSTTIGSLLNRNKRKVTYEIEGSYAQKSCKVYDERRECVAEIRRKEGKGGVVLGGDVFGLVVQPSINPATAMALVIAVDQMFDSSRGIFV